MSYPEITQVDGRGFFVSRAMILDIYDDDRDIFSPGDLAAQHLSAGPEFLATAFVYLYRRFGPPMSAYDRDKEITAYLLTTPEPDVLLWCLPGTDVRTSFGLGVRNDQMGPIHVLCDQSDEGVGRIIAALTASIQELMEPVLVRDVAMTVCGVIKEGCDGETS